MNGQRWFTLVAALAIAAGCTDRADQPAAPEAASPAETAPALAAGHWGQIQYFGYVGGSDQEMIDGVKSYANWGWFATDADPYSTAATSTINRLAAAGMKTIIDMGGLLWCGEGQTVLCPGWKDRLNSWRSANYNALYSGNVIAISVRDEPFALRANIVHVDSASQEVKRLFPAPAILLIDGADAVADADPNSWFNLYRHQLTVADWLALDKYYMYPDTSTALTTAMARMKTQWPNRRTAYAADGWWQRYGAHAAGLGTNDTTVMATVMRKWYDIAAADPAAILVGVFIWGDIPTEGFGSRNLPRRVVEEQMNIGRAITGRTRTQMYQPVGKFESLSAGGLATGWACDPDGAWPEAVQIEFYVEGLFAGSTLADQPSYDALISQCRGGRHHRFQAQLTRTGRSTVAVVRDLNAGTVTLSAPAAVSVEWVQPSGVSWGPPNTLTAAGLTKNGSGTVQMRWRDATTGGAWQLVSWAPSPSADGSWSNTIPTSNYCHDYQVYATYSGVNSPVFTYRGLTSGHCNEQARIIWIQPASTAGFGPAGSLVVAGSASGAPAGTGVVMWWRNVTLGGAWVKEAYTPVPDASGIWYHSIPNANPSYRYQVYVKYDVIQSASCTYAGTSSATWC